MFKRKFTKEMQIGDDLMLGPVFGGGGSLNSAGSSPMERGVGPMGRIYVWDVVPLLLQAAGLAASQNPASGGSFTLTAGTGVTTTVLPNGNTAYVLDVPRCVTVTAAGANTATYLISGFDQYGQAMSQLIAAPSTSTVATLKAFKIVTSIANANATAGTNNLTVGFNDTIGIPVRVLSRDYMTFSYNATVGLLSAITAAVTTSPATTATGDVRGTVALASASDGAKRLVAMIAMPAIAVGPNATRIGAYGVDQL